MKLGWVPRLQVLVAHPQYAPRQGAYAKSQGGAYSAMRGWADERPGQCTYWPQLGVVTPPIVCDYTVRTVLLNPTSGPDYPREGGWCLRLDGATQPGHSGSHDTEDLVNVRNKRFRYEDDDNVYCVQVQRVAGDSTWYLGTEFTPYAREEWGLNVLPQRWLFALDIAAWTPPLVRRRPSATESCPDCELYGIDVPLYQPHLHVHFAPSWPPVAELSLILLQHEGFGARRWAGPTRPLTLQLWWTQMTDSGYQSKLLREMALPPEALRTVMGRDWLHVFVGHVAGHLMVGFSESGETCEAISAQEFYNVRTDDQGQTYYEYIFPSGAVALEETVVTMHGHNLSCLLYLPRMAWGEGQVDINYLQRVYSSAPQSVTLAGYVPPECPTPTWSYNTDPPAGRGMHAAVQPYSADQMRLRVALRPAPDPSEGATSAPVHDAPALGGFRVHWPSQPAALSENWLDVSAAVTECSVTQTEPEHIGCVEARLTLDVLLADKFCSGWRDALRVGSPIRIVGGWQYSDGTTEDWVLLEGQVVHMPDREPGFRRAEIALLARDWLSRLQEPSGTVTKDFAPLDLLGDWGGESQPYGWQAAVYLLAMVLGDDFASELLVYIEDGHWTLYSAWPYRRGQWQITSAPLWMPPWGGDCWGWLRKVLEYDCAVMFMRRVGSQWRPIYGTWYALARSGLFSSWTVTTQPQSEDEYMLALRELHVEDRRELLYNEFHVYGTLPGGPNIPTVVYVAVDEQAYTDPSAPNYCPWPQPLVLEGTQYCSRTVGSAVAAHLKARFSGRRPARVTMVIEGNPAVQWGDTVMVREQTHHRLQGVQLRVVRVEHRFVKERNEFTTRLVCAPHTGEW